MVRAFLTLLLALNHFHVHIVHSYLISWPFRHLTPKLFPFLSSSSSTDTEAALQQLIVKFNCDAIDSEEISEVLFEAGVLSVSVEADAMNEIYADETKWNDLQKIRSWKTAILRAHVPRSFDTSSLIDMLETLFGADILTASSVTDIETKDWVASVQRNWPPQVIGDITVRFPWHSEEEGEGEGEETPHSLVLQGGAAFGTGDHPTTRLCCLWLQRNIQQTEERKKDTVSVLDYGTGSGLLGLAALKFGASSAAGTDIDRDSLVAARINCEVNNLHMDLYLATEEDCSRPEEQSIAMLASKGMGSEFETVEVIKKKEYDLTVANILAPILISLAPTLASHTKTGGKIALSGLVVQQADRVMEEYSKYFEGMHIWGEEEGWVVLSGTKK